jgi:acyl phosphate:glycerol-3-phosphate acyltransferase
VPTDVLIVAAGYLLGSIPFGYVVPRLVRGDDIRTRGSGNVGASNVFRLYGKWLAVPVAVLDVAKGFVPALVGVKVGGEWVGVLAGAAAMLGHARPVWLGFSKGGKMVATGGGVTFALAPLAALVCLAVFVVTFALTRYASVASLVTAITLPFACLLVGEEWPVVAFAAAAAVGVVVLHRQNLARLRAGTEPRFRRQPRPTADGAGLPPS